jgi:hypothetical protein
MSGIAPGQSIPNYIGGGGLGATSLNYQSAANSPEQARILTTLVHQISEQTRYAEEIAGRIRRFADELFGGAPTSPVADGESGPQPVRPIMEQVDRTIHLHTKALQEVEAQFTRLSIL